MGIEAGCGKFKVIESFLWANWIINHGLKTDCQVPAFLSPCLLDT